MPPRRSPPTTVPSTSSGRPSRRAASSTWPECASCRIRVEDTPSTMRDLACVEPEPTQQLQVARAPLPEAKPRACDDDLRADREQVLARELVRLESGDRRTELHHQGVLHPGVREQLEPPLERREQLDALGEHGPRMRVERDDGRDELSTAAGIHGRANDRPVTQVHAVERPDRDRARANGEVCCRARDVHAAAPPVGSPIASTPARIASDTRSSASGGRPLQRVTHRQENSVVDAGRLVDVERPHRGPAQRRAVPVESLGDRTHVRARADVQRQAHAVARIRDRRRASARANASRASRRRRPDARACTRARRRSSLRTSRGPAAPPHRGGARARPPVLPGPERRAARRALLRDRRSTSSRSGRHR